MSAITDLEATLNAYAAAWNTAQAGARRRHLERACVPAIAYTDPWGPLHGVAMLAAHIERVRATCPGAHWQPRSEVLGSGDRRMLCWVWTCGAHPRVDGHTLLRLDARQRILSATVRLRSRPAAWDLQPLQRLCKACGTAD